ncbi:siphovirus Gp157 family protein [Desulfohalobium retbaense]|uniref:Gp157 family protein n=1 Tax=Desulfohalobium retbaense (strain ATCC 49708 / DSM 5692 / JCM 16813 / HR100) TaxID=485915 RepID=C8X3A5_DESRD|nr:siphovirus Gp157 family protein [Desulfohalobium retbaense]ACV68902.1 hypothetical protein Dret_1618 [Desulfohalobium retbaense DSM 5692]
MTNLAAIEHEISTILTVADELDGEQQEVALDYLRDLGIQEEAKVDGISFAVRKRKNEIEWLKTEEKRIKARRQAIENRLEGFREYLRWLMEENGLQRLKGRLGSISLRNVDSVQVRSLGEVPREFVEEVVTYKARKREILNALKAGEAIPGASLHTRKVAYIR